MIIHRNWRACLPAFLPLAGIASAHADETVSIAGVEPFIKWSAGRARVPWLSGDGDPCEARGYHGFGGLDGRWLGLPPAFDGLRYE